MYVGHNNCELETTTEISEEDKPRSKRRKGNTAKPPGDKDAKANNASKATKTAKVTGKRGLSDISL